MSQQHSTTPAPSSKPAKPSKPTPDFPLTPHPAGHWCKKIRGKLYYFGPWDDPDGALRKYEEQKDALHAGRKPRPDAEGFTLKDACNAYLNHKQTLVDAGELAPRTWQEYLEICELMLAAFGKSRLVADLGPDDFASLRKKMAVRWGPTRLGNGIQRCRSVFKFVADNDLIDRPVKFGQSFARPSAKVLRLHRAKTGGRMIEAEELRKLLGKAGVPMKAMLLFGLNCGYGNHDIATLPLSAVDLERGWVNFPRPKTGIPRRCPLWPETVAALREAIAQRPAPRQEGAEGLVFLTVRGRQWLVRGIANPVSVAARALMKTVGIHGKGVGFYALRHVFRTIADEVKDGPAIDHIMGHSDPSMAAHYRERIADERLRAVVNHVRDWLFAIPINLTA